MMKPRILVDADACPVVRQVEAAAKRYDIEVILLCDENHVMHSEYARVQYVSSGADAVDIALMNCCRRGDIVVTQDYGVAAMVLGKGAFAMHHSGKEYTRQNIEILLMERHLAGKARRAKGKNHLKGPARFTEEDRKRFSCAFEKLIEFAAEASGGNVR